MNALTKVLSMAEEERGSRGLLFTPREIFQQPGTWRSTYGILLPRERRDVKEFLRDAGVGWAPSGRPTSCSLARARRTTWDERLFIS